MGCINTNTLHSYNPHVKELCHKALLLYPSVSCHKTCRKSKKAYVVLGCKIDLFLQLLNTHDMVLGDQNQEEQLQLKNPI